MKTLLSSLIAVSLVTSAHCADWPQWRGPQRNGISTETGLLREWPKEGPKLLWENKALGGGYSTPSVVGERLYVMGSEGMDNEFVQALSTKDGKRVWSTKVGKVGKNEGPNYPGSRSTPTVDGSVLYALGSDGDLACIEIANGKVKWAKNLRTDFGGKPGNWVYAESPLVDGDALVCTPGGEQATMVALNKNTGEPIWKAPLETADQAGYASPIVTEIGGKKQYVQFLQKGLVGVDAANGKLLWRYERTAKGSPANIPSPIADNGIVYSGAGRSGGGLINVKPTGGTFVVEEIVFTPKLPTAIGGAVKVGDHLYGTTGKALLCADFKTGQVKWEDPAVSPASVLFAENRLYLHGENNEVALAEASPEGYREKGRFTPANPPARLNRGEKAWAYPVVANGTLYIRDVGTLWAYDVKAR